MPASIKGITCIFSFITWSLSWSLCIGSIFSHAGRSVVFIAGGSDSIYHDFQYDVEVFDLRSSASACEAVPKVGISSLYAAANTFNGRAAFCGRDNTLQDCYTFNPERQYLESFVPLLHGRRTHASVQLAEDSFWILGKFNIFK